MLQVGDKAPDFELPDQDGKPVRLADLLASGPVVVYFYPAAMTFGCTKESCHFRDLASDFDSVGAARVGISNDPVGKQKQFDDKHSLGFPLLSDTDQKVAEAFGVKKGGLTPVKRATFVIDRDATVREVFSSEVRFAKHADQALETLRKLG